MQHENPVVISYLTLLSSPDSILPEIGDYFPMNSLIIFDILNFREGVWLGPKLARHNHRVRSSSGIPTTQGQPLKTCL